MVAKNNTHRGIEYLQLLANIGVVVGLFFVGYQIIQDRDHKRAELYGVVFQDNHSRHLALMGENPAAALAKLPLEKCLSEEEQIVVQAYYDAIAAIWARSSLLEQEGLFPARWREAISLDTKFWRNQIAMEAIDRQSQNHVFNLEFREQLAEVVKQSKVTYDPRCKNTPSPPAASG